MTKLNLILTSLVAAIPGGVMVVLIIMAILSKSEHMSVMFHATNVILLLASATVMLMPVIIAIWYGRETPAPAAGAAPSQPDADDEPDTKAVADDVDDDAMVDEGDDLADLADDDDDLGDFDDEDDDWDQ